MIYTFCPKCGSKLEERKINNKIRKYCGSCGFIHYKNPTVGVAVILQDDNYRLLLGKRADGGWCIPCGYVEWDESVEEAAIREFKEETGLDVVLEDVFAVHSNFHDFEKHTVGIWYLGQWIGGILEAADDLLEVQWFRLKEVPELKFPTDKIVLEKLFRIEKLNLD